MEALVTSAIGQPSPTQDLVVRRILDAPPQLVWQMWTEPDRLVRWWGPQHFTSPGCSVDLRVGGRYVFAMQAPPELGGQVSYTSGSYSRVEPGALLEFDTHLSDRHGSPIDPASLGLPPDFPARMTNTVTFTPRRGLTELTVVEHGWTPGQMYVFSYAGMHQSIDKLAAVLDAG
jgi:uncharacterized protein YndB with AHSA1/START domain